MDHQRASKGYKYTGTGASGTVKFYGFTPTADAVLTSITAPTDNGGEVEAYDGDETGIAGPTLTKGVFYPIMGDAVNVASGGLILWLR